MVRRRRRRRRRRRHHWQRPKRRRELSNRINIEQYLRRKYAPNPYNLNFMKNIKANNRANVYRQRDCRSKNIERRKRSPELSTLNIYTCFYERENEFKNKRRESAPRSRSFVRSLLSRFILVCPRSFRLRFTTKKKKTTITCKQFMDFASVRF